MMNPIPERSLGNFLKIATKAINDNKLFFEAVRRNNEKLAAVKELKDLTGGGLKECKEVCDLFWDNKLIDVKGERKAKLERLAKKPLVDELVEKIKNLKYEELNLLLMNLTVDELLSIDEFFEKI